MKVLKKTEAKAKEKAEQIERKRTILHTQKKEPSKKEA